MLECHFDLNEHVVVDSRWSVCGLSYDIYKMYLDKSTETLTLLYRRECTRGLQWWCAVLEHIGEGIW